MDNSRTHDVSDDLARLKQVEAQLQRMTKVFMDGADPIVIRDLDGNVIDVNHETVRVFGWKREELIGARTKHLLTPEYQKTADETLARVQRGEIIRNAEAAVRTSSGNIVPVLVTAFCLTQDGGQPIGYAQIIKDITHLKQVTEQLQQRNRELQRFANILAHDLGAPLRSVRYFSEFLRNECGNSLNEQGIKHLDHIQESVRRMDRLIEELLEFSRIEGQNVSFAQVACNLAFDQAVGNLQADIVPSGAQVTRDELPTITANQSQIVQLFQNLLGNAIKFRGVESPLVHASARRCEVGWEFSVRDNGIGMDEEHLHTVFDIFHRLHVEDEFPGMGVGLAICKAVVERHGGTIWVESKRDEGSTFRFTIPDPDLAASR